VLKLNAVKPIMNDLQFHIDHGCYKPNPIEYFFLQGV
jgi:hypothetical protein